MDQIQFNQFKLPPTLSVSFWFFFKQWSAPSHVDQTLWALSHHSSQPGWGSRCVPVSRLDYGPPEQCVSVLLSFHPEPPLFPLSQVEQSCKTAMSKQNLARTETSTTRGWVISDLKGKVGQGIFGLSHPVCRINSRIYQLMWSAVWKAIGKSHQVSSYLASLWSSRRQPSPSGTRAVPERQGTGQEGHSPSPPGHTRVCHKVLVPSTNLPEGKGTDQRIPGQFLREGRDVLCLLAHLPSKTIWHARKGE